MSVAPTITGRLYEVAPQALPVRRVPPLVLRRAAPGDERLLAELLEGLSGRTRYLRYFTARPLAGPAALGEARRILRGAAALLATTAAGEEERVLAVAELAVSGAEPGVGEAAVVVRDEDQGRGIGTLLARYLLWVAHQQGIAVVRFVMLAENRAALGMVRRLGAPHTVTRHGGEVHAEVRV